MLQRRASSGVSARCNESDLASGQRARYGVIRCPHTHRLQLRAAGRARMTHGTRKALRGLVSSAHCRSKYVRRHWSSRRQSSRSVRRGARTAERAHRAQRAPARRALRRRRGSQQRCCAVPCKRHSICHRRRRQRLAGQRHGRIAQHAHRRRTLEALRRARGRARERGGRCRSECSCAKAAAARNFRRRAFGVKLHTASRSPASRTLCTSSRRRRLFRRWPLMLLARCGRPDSALARSASSLRRHARWPPHCGLGSARMRKYSSPTVNTSIAVCRAWHARVC
jgi:hypothetical protein